MASVNGAKQMYVTENHAIQGHKNKGQAKFNYRGKWYINPNLLQINIYVYDMTMQQPTFLIFSTI